MKGKVSKTFFWLTIFAIAMGYMETAVVVYLREIYYPGGFGFPLKPVDFKIGITELVREAATIIMLAGAGVLTGRTRTERFGNFVYSFAVWDIFYYVFLKIILDWPESPLTWDLLFLIPVPWIGPVICPVINSLSMILLAICISYFTNKADNIRLSATEWTLLITGSAIVILSYTLDYSIFILKKFSLSGLFDIKNREIITEYSSKYLPQHFNWWIFATGEIAILAGIVLFVQRYKKFIHH